ncbi:MAG TPA: hypothetical protein VLI06_04950, partial [Solimonas sp.]|nr:hypothetical protein [Solimonas sp.]
YFWEEAEAIGRLLTTERCSEDQAAARVLGISYQDLGIGVARSWGFPEPIIHSMRRLPAGKPARPNSTVEQLRLFSVVAGELGGILENTAPEQRGSAIAQLAARYGDSLPLGARELGEVVSNSIRGIAELAGTLNISLARTKLGSKLVAAEAEAAPAEGKPAVAATGQAANGLEAPADTGDHPDPADAEAILAAGIQDISKALVEDFPLNDMLRIIAETIYRAIGVRRVLMCTRDPRSGMMRARFGFGANCEEAVRQFEFPLGGSDLFNLILGKDADVLIRDATDARIKARLPDWYQSRFAAPCFIVFPMRVRNVPAAMIYADADKPNGIVVSERELSLLHTLRNQAVLAIKQSP